MWTQSQKSVYFDFIYKLSYMKILKIINLIILLKKTQSSCSSKSPSCYRPSLCLLYSKHLHKQTPPPHLSSSIWSLSCCALKSLYCCCRSFSGWHSSLCYVDILCRMFNLLCLLMCFELMKCEIAENLISFWS